MRSFSPMYGDTLRPTSNKKKERMEDEVLAYKDI